MKKFYFVLSVFLALGGLRAVRAQDTAVCNAGFEATRAGNTVYFRAMDSLSGVQHNWNFGDGSTSSSDSFIVNHTYPGYGQYVITQVVIDAAHSCRDSASQVVNFAPPPPPCGVYVTETSDSIHHVYTFVADVTVAPGAADTVNWTINGTPAGMGDTLIKSLTGGTYNVCALLSSGSCGTQFCLTINPQDSVPTTPPPPPDTCTIGFTAAPKDNSPNQYVFTLIDPNRYDSMYWFINSSDSSFAGPFHNASFTYTFPDTGYYLIAIYAVAPQSGCFASNAQYIHIDSIPAQSGNTINSYPNPATTQVSLGVTLTSYSTVDIRVYNSMGGQVLSRSVSGYPGVNQITLPIATLPIGVYYIELQYGGTILRSKVQKLSN